VIAETARWLARAPHSAAPADRRPAAER